MTGKEHFIKALRREPVSGRVPHFELVFFLTMEVLGKVHPQHREYSQWHQMSRTEQKLHIADIARCYVDVAKKYEHSAIFVQPFPDDFDALAEVLYAIREQSGDDYFLMMHGDPTWAIPNGDSMMDFSAQMYEEPEVLNKESARRTEEALEFARKMRTRGAGLLDGFGLCSDYCFNTNPFFSPDSFEELIAPWLKAVINGYREMGYYSIKHTDGNVMPIIENILACGPDALHSLDPQGGVDLGEVVARYGGQVCLIGNVNCALLQTGTQSECEADVRRSLRQGITAPGYIFSTSNCVYTGMPLERYELMHRIWMEEGFRP